MEVNVDPSRLAPEGLEHIDHGIAALGGPVVDHGNRKIADQLAVKSPHRGAEALQRGREVLACLVDDPALVGEVEAGSSALAKTHAEASFQIANLAADGGLADV